MEEGDTQQGSKDEGSQAPNLLSLSDECLILILSSLDEKDLLAGAGATCTVLHRLAVDPMMWKRLFFQRWPLKKKEETETQDWLQQYKSVDALLRTAIKFNEDPALTMRTLISEGLLTSPEEIADFLCNTPDILPCAVSYYLLSKQGQELLPLYLGCLNLKDLGLDAGLRLFLSKIKLPGESQLIDKFIEEFSKQYYEKNKDTPEFPFVSADAVYICCFSCIMLNTDAHTSAITTKMTHTQFKMNMRGTNGGNDLPDSLVDKLYAGIVAHEFTRPNIYDCKAHLLKSGFFSSKHVAISISLTDDNELCLYENDQKYPFLKLKAVKYNAVNEKGKFLLKVECRTTHTTHTLVFASDEERKRLIDALESIERFRTATKPIETTYAK